jgi:DNA-binding NarL/FixJ family response regulator
MQKNYFLEKLKKIRNTHLALKIVLVTDRADPDFIFEIISIDICGIIPANAQWADIVSHLEKIELGLAPMTPKVARVILDSFRLNLIPDLSKRQVEILKFPSASEIVPLPEPFTKMFTPGRELPSSCEVIRPETTRS